VPTEVRITPRADQQLKALDRRQTTQFDAFVDELVAGGCAALAYRLSGPTPIDQVCVKHLRDELRVTVVFESDEVAWIYLIGPHDDRDPAVDIYVELYRTLGVEPEADSGRAKPPCCDEDNQRPPILGEQAENILTGASRLRHTRRRRSDQDPDYARNDLGEDDQRQRRRRR